MDIKEILREAEQIVAEAEISEEMRSVAFGRVLDALISTQGFSEVSQVSETEIETEIRTTVGRIAKRLGLSTEEVEEVYFEDGDGLGIGLASPRLDPGKAGATKQLALLVAVGRQAAGLDEEWTSSIEIRKWCDEFGKYDSSNFAGTLLEMADVFQFRGSRQQREVKVRRLGFERAAELVRRLAMSAHQEPG